MYGRDAYLRAPWAAGVLPPANPGVLPPPIPGDPATFAYDALQVARPWAYLSWAGGYPPSPYPGGGILAHADSPAGLVHLQAWWPDATLLHIVRILGDGSRYPVRGAYPATVVGTTRRNRALNPSLEAGLNGYVPAEGTPILTRRVDPDAPAGTAVLRLTYNAATSIGVTVPAALSGLAANSVTVGFALRLNYTYNVTVAIAWTDSGGAPISTSSYLLSITERSSVYGAFARIVTTLARPAGATDGTLKISTVSFGSGGTLDLDAITVEDGATDGTPVDGDMVGGTWLATPHLSASVLAPPQLLADAEAPLDTPLSYELAYQAITGGRVTSTPPVLLSGDDGSWITHPARPGEALKVVLTRVPRLERTVAQGVFLPIGARMPVVVSAARRQAPTSTLEFVTLSFPERDALLAYFDPPAPVLLRFPREFGYTAPLWLAIGRLTEDRGERKGFHDSVILEAEVTEVAAPAVT